MNNDLRLSKVLPIVIIAIILIVGSLKISALSLLLLIPIPFALIGTLSNVKNNIISLVITFVALYFFVGDINATDIFINSIIPGTIMGIITRKVINTKESNKYMPIFIGTIVFMVVMVIYYIISKSIFKIDLVEELLQVFNATYKNQDKFIKLLNNELFNSNNITDIFRNVISSVLFFRAIISAIIVYSFEIFILKKLKYKNLSQIKFRNFYLPGNAIAISFILYILIMALSYMKTPLNTDAIFLNLEITFTTMFILQGISVSIYFLMKWLNQGINKIAFVGFLCLGIFGFSAISFIGMLDSILDFRKLRVHKSM